jgi:hypothetical protein
MRTERGLALILVILVTSFLSALGLGLALIVVMDQLATGNMRGSVALLYAADAALELTVRDLSRLDDWDRVLAGDARGSFTDGDPPGRRDIPGGGVIDLAVATNQLSCGRSTDCTDAQIAATTRERPWAQNNPRWRLFAYGPLGRTVQLPRAADCYVAVWVGDDGREEDGEPDRDAPAEAPGHGIVRVRVDAYGPQGTRRAIDAELARLCIDGGTPCRRGIRVQSWQEVRQTVP